MVVEVGVHLELVTGAWLGVEGVAEVEVADQVTQADHYYAPALVPGVEEDIA